MSEPTPAVFLSYASQDAEVAKRIAEALRAAGVEVWFDQNELVGGDAWDQKIRGQIKACALFVPVISAATQARREGYFRLEWKLAAQRTHMISERQAFLLPVVIDATSDAAADVPEEFRAVQWTRLPGGERAAVEKFCGRARRLLEGAMERVAVPAAVSAEVSRAEPRRTLRWTAVLAAVLALGGTGWWLAAKRPANAPATNQAAVEPAAEVLRLVERARQLRVLNDLTRERLGAAEELLKQAAKISPTDPDVLAVQAQVDVLMSYRSWDRSEERRQAAGQRAARAVALAPDGFESRRAQAMVAAFMLQSPEALQEAEATYRRLTGERPSDANVLGELGTILLWQGKPLEAARIFTQAGQRLLAATAQMWAGQARQARDGAVALLAERRSVGALVLKANVDLFSFNDREAARVSVSQLTPTELREDDAAGIALRLAVLSADAPGLLKLMEQFPHPFVSILGINYPRRYWTGMAREWLKQPDAARIEWRAALQTIEERLKANPADSDALSWAALLHMCLGDVAATEQALRAYRNYRDLSTGYWDFHYCLPLLRVAGGEDEAIDRLEKTLRAPPDGRFNTMVYAWARFSPEFDPLRGKPRFEQLLREMRPADAVPFSDERSVAPTAVPEKSVAVLAFANVGGDKDNEIFSDGISEELINVLGRVPGLTVKGRASSFFFKGSTATAQEKGQRLGATYLVDGSVRRQGNAVRITAQVSRAATDEVVWTSEPLVRELKDMWAVQEEIAGLIAQALSLKLGVVAAGAKAEVNPEVYRLYLEGRAAWRQRTAAGETKAEQLFRQALALDPNFARGHAGLADVWVVRSQRENSAGQFKNRNDAVMDQAMASARRALQLDPSLAEAHGALGTLLWMDWKLDEAIREHRAAVALNPSDATAHQRLGRALLTDGRMDEALEALRRAHELDPLFARIADNYSVALISGRRLEEAVAMADRALALQPELRQAVAYKAVALADLGRKEEVLAVARRYVERAGPLEQDATPSMVAYALARVNAAGEAERLLARVPEEKRQAVTAAAWLALGKREEAFAVLRAGNSNATGSDSLLWWPVFDAVREEPEFKAMIAAMGFTEAHARAQAWRAGQAKGR